MLKHSEIIRKMSLEEKIRLTSGQDYWRTKEFEHLGIPRITMCDGPHGLRHQEESQDHLELNESNEATCFPLACLTAASFDENLLFELGSAIGYEALCQNVQVVLGPGANIKRNPLCGRNFEYFSEDPYLSSKMAASWIKGIQSLGISASLKHFAMNNQENYRMKSNSIVDERTKHEIYLKAFEEPVKEAKPSTVMCSYNLIDGTYASDNKELLKDILRDKWGYEGVIVTDWGAMNDRVAAFKAGLDLEMPGSEGYFDETIRLAIKDGILEESLLDESVDRLLDLIFRMLLERKKMESELGEFSIDIQKHHALAGRIAGESAVLLRNERNLLPLLKNPQKKIKVVGRLARDPRYQGAGSSHINPYFVSSILSALGENQVDYDYYEGYSLKDKENSKLLIDEAIGSVTEDDLVILVLGLPGEYESEGFDREHMRLPDAQNRLVERMAEKNSNIIVVLFGGAPVEMPWIGKVGALLNMYLPGQAGGDAAYDILFGAVNPSGRLPETYPVRYEDHITASYYATQRAQVEYREGIYVGYRYFDKINKEVRFPFGFGLSYTTFEYSELILDREHIGEGEELSVKLSFKIKNVGSVSGKEVAQVYITSFMKTFMTAERSLKAFHKIFLEPGEEKEVSFCLSAEAFETYDVGKKAFVVYDGDYGIVVGASSRDARMTSRISLVTGNAYVEHPELSFYNCPDRNPTRDDLEALLGETLEEVLTPDRHPQYTMTNTLMEMNGSLAMRIVIGAMNHILKKSTGANSDEDTDFKGIQAMLMETPLGRLSLLSPDQMPNHLGEAILHIANGEYGKAIKKALYGKMHLVKKKDHHEKQ